MKKILGYLTSPVHYIGFGIILTVFHPIQWLSVKYGGYSMHKRVVDFMNLLLVLTYHLVGARVRFSNSQDLPVNRPIIFVANHQSMYDVPPLIWYLRRYHAKFISKIELTRGIPSVSINLKYGGGANIDRKDSKQAVAEILGLAKRMNERNWSTVIFPEGTRSKDGDLKSFAVGGIATILKKVPHALIVPICIDGSWKLTRYGMFPLSFGDKITWTVLQPLEAKDSPVEQLVAECERRIQIALAKPSIG
jgi:1-acyl-sn-glycerol-3-phosphate acyltransferase